MFVSKYWLQTACKCSKTQEALVKQFGKQLQIICIFREVQVLWTIYNEKKEAKFIR